MQAEAKRLWRGTETAIRIDNDHLDEQEEE